MVTGTDRRIQALDGLRGVAILLVVIYHAADWWTGPGVERWLLPYGGPYGVLLFFVLSGFLITNVLLREIEANGEVGLFRFYARRARRLFPALGLILVALPLLFAVLGEPIDEFFRLVFVPTATYTASFVRASGGHLGPMSHTWSLAVEEHFYLLWPAVLGILGNRRLRGAALLLAAFFGWRTFLNVSGGFNRSYWSTDGSAFALLAGCVLALAVRERSPAPRWMAPIGVGGIILASSVPLGDFEQVILWGSLPVTLIAVMAVWGCAKSVPWMERNWLVWFGTISYGLYLWHYPILELPVLAGWHPLVRSVPLLSLAVGVSWLSWVLWEKRWLGPSSFSVLAPRKKRVIPR